MDNGTRCAVDMRWRVFWQIGELKRVLHSLEPFAWGKMINGSLTRLAESEGTLKEAENDANPKK
jgi:hypothetical protein